MIARWTGSDVPRFVREVFGTRISGFFGWDVVVASGTLLTAAAADRELIGRQRAIVSMGALSGTSVGLSLYLWLRERSRPAPPTGGGDHLWPGPRAPSPAA